MGHANLSNISRTASRVLRTKGKATIKEIVEELERIKQAIHAGEGLITDRAMLALATEEYLSFLLAQGLVEPVNLSATEAKVLREWGTEAMNDWNYGQDGISGDFAILDAIRWETKRRHALPLLRYVTH